MIRVCAYNIEWFDRLFDGNDQPLESADAKKRAAAICDVLSMVDADIVGVVEAPRTTKGSRSTVAALQNFSTTWKLPFDGVVTGFASAGNQELALWYDSSKLTISHDPGGKKKSKTNPPFDKSFRRDTDEDRVEEIYKHDRPPLEARVSLKDGTEFHVLLVHAKSKGIFRAVDLVRLRHESDRNRRKLFAEAFSIRQRVDDWLAAERHFVVMGDVNDGPGMDFYEQRYGRSALEIILGDLFEPERILRTMCGRPRWGEYGWRPSSARFRDRITEEYVNVLIDYVLVSPGFKASNHRIWNPYEDDRLRASRKALRAASDHFPVSVDVDLE